MRARLPQSASTADLDPDVEACLSPGTRELGRGRAFYEVGRARDRLGTYVYVAIADPDDRAAEVESALLLFQRDGPCVSLLDYEGAFYSVEEAAPAGVLGPLQAAFGRWLDAWEAGVTP